jgi:hypothetical protein
VISFSRLARESTHDLRPPMSASEIGIQGADGRLLALGRAQGGR